MPYIAHSINLSPAQAKSLKSGGSVRLKHNQLQGPHKIHLTGLQMRKFAKASKAGTGCMMRLDPKQLAYNVKTGGGWLDVLKSIGRVVAPIAQIGSQFLPPQYGAPLGMAGNIIGGLSGDGIKKRGRKAGGTVKSELTKYIE